MNGKFNQAFFYFLQLRRRETLIKAWTKMQQAFLLRVNQYQVCYKHERDCVFSSSCPIQKNGTRILNNIVII